MQRSTAAVVQKEGGSEGSAECDRWRFLSLVWVQGAVALVGVAGK